MTVNRIDIIEITSKTHNIVRLLATYNLAIMSIK